VNLLEELERNLDKTIEEMSLSGEISAEMMDQISTEITPDGLKLELASSALFPAGSAQILPAMKETLKRLNIAILRLPAGQFIMRVEGHTDDVPISTAEFRSNWELASDRAINVLNLFEADGFPSNQLAAVSFADTQPKVPNRTAQGEPIRINQAKNRRVVVFIKPVTQ
jgi:chemotaxis protein MotB